MTLLENEDSIDPVEYVRKKFNLAADVHIDPIVAKSKLDADNYIKIMEKQKDEIADSYLKLKADYEARAKLEEIADQLASRDSATNLNANNTKPQTIDPIDIEKLLDSRLSAYEKKKKADENLKIVKDQLREKFGSNYTNVLRSKMDELDLSEAEMDSLAARSPKAFMRTVAPEEAPKKDPFVSPNTTYRSDNFKKNEEVRDWDYYQKLKETNPRAWLDPKIQTQMYNDSQKLGARFATEDFNKYSERLPQ